MDKLVLIIGAFLVWGSAYLFVVTSSATGPGCPGRDPSWLGYCDKAPFVP